MKIQIEHYDVKVTGEIPDETNLEEVMELITGLISCLGFHRESIKDYFKHYEIKSWKSKRTWK